MAHLVEGKAHQQVVKKPVCLERGKAQEGWRKSSMEKLRKKAEEHCGKGVLEEAQLLELG